MKHKEQKVFTKAVRVSGNLGSSFVFTDEAERKAWLKTEYPKLQTQYGDISYRCEDLPGLRIGDTCCVAGEGMDKFEIKALLPISPARYSFLVQHEENGCWSEEVYKCFRPY